MSKMKQIDAHVADVQNELCESLAQWLMDAHSEQDVLIDQYDYDKDILINVLQAWFDGTEEGACPHDWIGEALCRREECAALIEQRVLGDDLTCDPAPCNAHLQRPEETPANGYVQLHYDGNYKKRGSLDELITDAEYSDTYELGVKLKVKRSVQWEVDDDDQDATV